MKIRVISIGKTNVDFVKTGLEQYLKRLGHYCSLDWLELQDIKQVDKQNKEHIKQKEGEKLLEQLKPTDKVVLLDEHGKGLTSTQLASWIDNHMIYEPNDLVFIIGGAYGFSEALYTRCDQKISLSPLTFNHQMVRLIFTEQLYRAFTIIKGEPYHHS